MKSQKIVSINNNLDYYTDEELKEFLESYGLYIEKKLDRKVVSLDYIDFPSVKLVCDCCNSQETFMFQRKFTPPKQINGPIKIPSKKEFLNVEYKCANCEALSCFLIELDKEHESIMKAGQIPKLNINPEPNIKRLLEKSKLELYKNGIICELQGYGIGAFAYYRRIVEEIIDELLEKTKNIIQNDEEKEKFSQSLKKIESSHNASDKIDIVKNQLPDVLKKEYNYFGIIYSILSSGIHKYDDEKCLDISIDLKNTLLDLINQLELYQHPKKLNEQTKKLLEKRNEISKKS